MSFKPAPRCLGSQGPASQPEVSKQYQKKSVIAPIAMGDKRQPRRSSDVDDGQTGQGGGLWVVVGIVATIGASLAGLIVNRKHRKHSSEGPQHAQDVAAGEANIQSRELDLATMQQPVASLRGYEPEVPHGRVHQSAEALVAGAAAEQQAGAAGVENLFTKRGEEKDAMFGVGRPTYDKGQIRPEGFSDSKMPTSPAAADTQLRQLKPEAVHVQDMAPGQDKVVQDTRKGSIFLTDLDSKDRFFGIHRKSGNQTQEVSPSISEHGGSVDTIKNPFLRAKDEKDAFFGVGHTAYKVGQIQPVRFGGNERPHTRTGSDVKPELVKPENVIVQETAPGLDKVVQDTRTGDVFTTDLDSKDRFFGIHGKFPSKGSADAQGTSISGTKNPFLKDKDCKDALFGVKRQDYGSAQVVPKGFDSLVPSAAPAADSGTKPLGPGEIQKVHELAVDGPAVTQQSRSAPLFTEDLLSKDKFFGVHGKWPKADFNMKSDNSHKLFTRGFPARKKPHAVKALSKSNKTAMPTGKTKSARKDVISKVVYGTSVPLKLTGPIARLVPQPKQDPKSTDGSESLKAAEVATVLGCSREAPMKKPSEDANSGAASVAKDEPSVQLTLSRTGEKFKVDVKPAADAKKQDSKAVVALVKEEPKGTGVEANSTIKVVPVTTEKAVKPTEQVGLRKEVTKVPMQDIPKRSEQPQKSATVQSSPEVAQKSMQRGESKPGTAASVSEISPADSNAGSNSRKPQVSAGEVKPSSPVGAATVAAGVTQAKAPQETPANVTNGPLVVHASNVPIDSGIGSQHDALKPIVEERRTKVDAPEGGKHEWTEVKQAADNSQENTVRSPGGGAAGGSPQVTDTSPDNGLSPGGHHHRGGHHHHARHHHHGHHGHGGWHGGRGGPRHRGRKRP